MVIIIGDNGSPPEVTASPFDANRSKGTVFQGGIRVPFLALGPGIDQDETVPDGEIVGAVDLYPTILALAGLTPGNYGGDGVDLAPYFTDQLAGLRSYLYSETFFPNFDPTDTDQGPTSGQQAIRDTQYGYKYVRRTDGSEGLFDLATDPWEDDDKIDELCPDCDLQVIYDDLVAEMDSIEDDLLGICPAGRRVGDTCSAASDCCSKLCVTGVCANPVGLEECN